MLLLTAALTLCAYGYGLAVFTATVDALGGDYRFSARAPLGRCYGWRTMRSVEMRCYPSATATVGP